MHLPMENLIDVLVILFLPKIKYDSTSTMYIERVLERLRYI